DVPAWGARSTKDRLKPRDAPTQGDDPPVSPCCHDDPSSLSLRRSRRFDRGRLHFISSVRRRCAGRVQAAAEPWALLMSEPRVRRVLVLHDQTLLVELI